MKMPTKSDIRAALQHIAAKGGKSKSPAKVKASRENGRQGGWPGYFAGKEKKVKPS